MTYYIYEQYVRRDREDKDGTSKRLRKDTPSEKVKVKSVATEEGDE